MIGGIGYAGYFKEVVTMYICILIHSLYLLMKLHVHTCNSCNAPPGQHEACMFPG